MTKQDVLNTWLTYAQADLDAAERLLKSPNPNNWTFLLSAWHCHQAIEKILKMVIIGQGKENLKVHDLLRLVELSGLNFADQQLGFIKELNQYYSQQRYPDIAYPSLPRLAQKHAHNLFELTQELFLWLKQQSQN